MTGPAVFVRDQQALLEVLRRLADVEGGQELAQ